MNRILQISIGLATGYVIASMAESFQHHWFGHSPRWMQRIWKRYPRLLSWLRKLWWGHMAIHHFTASGKWFCSPQTKQAAVLSRMTPEERSVAIGTQFGLTIMLNSFIWFMWLPMTTLPLLWVTIGGLGTIAALVPMALPPLLSKLVHRHIHCSYSVAIRESSLAVRWLLKTRYGRAMIRHHWLHHRYPGTNFNLLLGGDWILRVARRPTDDDNLKMSAQGIPLD
jgi:hypothetical protein